MKKILLLLGAATAITSASAINPGKTISGELNMIPESMTYEGKSVIISITDNRIIKAYNSSLENIATITVDSPKKIEYGNNGYYSLVYGYTEMYLCGGLSDDPFSLSQTFFNDDEKFEYIVPKVEKGTNQQGKEEVMTTGYSVMSQDGSKLFDIDIPAEYHSYYYHSNTLHAYILDGRKYIVYTQETYSDDNTVYVSLFYELDQKGGVKAPVIVKGSLKVSPSAPRHGETVNVDLGDESDGATTVNIVSANGSTVRSLPVSAGSRNVSLSTAGLASGLYIVTANGREAAKIIIR